jgi:hypothetical protein
MPLAGLLPQGPGHIRDNLTTSPLASGQALAGRIENRLNAGGIRPAHREDGAGWGMTGGLTDIPSAEDFD